VGAGARDRHTRKRMSSAGRAESAPSDAWGGIMWYTNPMLWSKRAAMSASTGDRPTLAHWNHASSSLAAHEVVSHVTVPTGGTHRETSVDIQRLAPCGPDTVPIAGSPWPGGTSAEEGEERLERAPVQLAPALHRTTRFTAEKLSRSGAILHVQTPSGDANAGHEGICRRTASSAVQMLSLDSM
jgi:hypothetical protein